MIQNHPKKIIETEDGKIVMSKPDMSRTSALSNSMYSYILSDEDLLKLNKMETDQERNEFIKIKSLKMGFTTYQLTILSYVESAPFHLNDYAVEPIFDLKSFLNYVDADLLKKMGDTMKELGQIDPLSP